MKKISAVLLIAVLAGGLVFAGFSGSATIGLGANFDNGQYGFIDKGTNVQFNVDLATASGEAIGEGKIYAEIKGSLKLFILNDADGGSGADPYAFGLAKITGNVGGAAALALVAKIDTAKIAGENWYVSLLGVPSVPDYAKSAIDTYTVKNKLDDYGVRKADATEKVTYKTAYAKAPGLEFGISGYKFGFGMKAQAVKTPEFKPFDKLFLTAYAATPEYELADGLKLQVAAVYTKADADSNFGAGAKNDIGAAVKVAYASDALSAGVASDVGYSIAKEEFNADVALNVAYAPVALDVYYKTNATTYKTWTDAGAEETKTYADKNLLSAQVVADLNEFDVPVKVTVAGKDLVNKQKLSASVEVAVMDGLTLTPKGGYAIADKKWNAGLDVKYVADAFTVKAGASAEAVVADNAPILLGASASIESASLVPGATLKLAWSDADDLLDKFADETNYGKLIASCKIAF